MFYNSYLNPHTIRESCRDYITYLEKENLVYDEIPKLYDSILNSGDGDYMEAFKILMAGVGSHMSSLRRANDYDIEDANTFINIVGEEIYDGSVIFSGKQRALLDINNYGSKASSCYSNAYQATDPDMISYWRGQGSYYDGLVNDARGVYNLYEQKEKRYDEINELSKPLFVRGAELRDVIINDNPLSSMEYVGIDYSTIEEMINGSRDSDSGHGGNGYPNNPLVPPPGSINGEQGHDLFLGPKSSYTDNMQEFVLKYPELADMVNLQGHIIDKIDTISNNINKEAELGHLIDKLNEIKNNIKKDAELGHLIDKIDMIKNNIKKDTELGHIKELNDLIFEQRMLFSSNFYKFDDNGHIIGNNLEDWKKDNKTDLIDFFKDIFNSNNNSYVPIDLSKVETISLKEAIDKLSKIKDNVTDSILMTEIQKEIDRLNSSGVDSVLLHSITSNNHFGGTYKTANQYQIEQLFASMCICEKVIVNVNDYIKDNIPKEQMEMIIHDHLYFGSVAKLLNLKYVGQVGVGLNLSFLSMWGLSLNAGLLVDGNDQIAFTYSGGTGLSAGPDTATGGVFGANLVMNSGGYLTDDINNLGDESLSIGVGDGIAIPLPDGMVLPLYGSIDAILSADNQDNFRIPGGTVSLGIGTPGPDVHITAAKSSTKVINIVDAITDTIYE